MNIHHHHTIHFCSSCSCCRNRTHCGETRTEPGELRPRTSILEALGNLARLAALISLLRVTSDRSGHETASEQVATDPIAPQTDAPSTDAILALFSQAAPEQESAPPSTEVKPTMSPLVAAFLTAFRDEPSAT